MKKFTGGIVLISLALYGNITQAQENKFLSAFTVDAEDLKVKFDGRFAYSINGIQYKDKNIGLENKGYYGTVINFPGIGFIGTGHIENEKEQVLNLELFASGKKILPSVLAANPIIKDADFKLVRTSKIKDIEILNVITVKNNIIDEAVKITAATDTKLALLYNFMHPCTTEIDQYMALLSDGKIEEGKFRDDGSFHVNNDIVWVAFYSIKLKTGILFYVSEKYPGTKTITMLWDKKDIYRKFYLRSFHNEELKKDTPVNFHVRVTLFEADADNWKQAAEKSLAMLNEKTTE